MYTLPKKKKSFSHWPSHWGWSSREIPGWRLEVCWVYFLLLINVGTLNEIRAGWVWGEMHVSEITHLLSNCQTRRHREGKGLPKVKQQHWDFCLLKEEPNNVRSLIPILSPPWKTWEAGGHLVRRPSSQGDLALECVGETRCLLFQARVWPERTLVICCPPLFRLVCQFYQQSARNMWGSVKVGRWQDIRDQSSRDVPEPLLLCFLSRGSYLPSQPHLPGGHGWDPRLLRCLGLLHLKMDQDKLLKLGCWIKGFRFKKKSTLLLFMLFCSVKSHTTGNLGKRKHLEPHHP